MCFIEKEGEHQKSTKFLMMISEGKQALKAIANDECTEAKPILNRFEERYESDIKVLYCAIYYRGIS